MSILYRMSKYNEDDQYLEYFAKKEKKLEKIDYLILKIERLEKLLSKLHDVQVKALPREKIMFVGESDNED